MPLTMTRPNTLQLASTSPRRREILSALGLEFTVVHVDVDETPRDGERPDEMVVRLAVAKAEAAPGGTAAAVVAADTAVVVDDRTLGKPGNEEECVAMLAALAARRHKVFTGVALRTATGIRTALSATDVYFRDIGRDEALAYWQSGEPRDKAGAYGIQGLGGLFVERIEGSYSGVVGLPVFETAALLEEAGFGPLDRRIP